MTGSPEGGTPHCRNEVGINSLHTKNKNYNSSI
jgi:hypothetical protein